MTHFTEATPLLLYFVIRTTEILHLPHYSKRVKCSYFSLLLYTCGYIKREEKLSVDNTPTNNPKSYREGVGEK